MFLIVGLGNPGDEYEWSRHNLGLMLIDKLAADAAVTVKRRECRSLVGSAVIEGHRVRLRKLWSEALRHFARFCETALRRQCRCTTDLGFQRISDLKFQI